MTVLQRLAGEREAAEKPHQAFGSGSLFLALFVVNQLFESARESGGGIVSGADFLCSERETSSAVILPTHDDVALDIILHGREGDGTQQICGLDVFRE